jgi:hypothetical protein
VEESAGTLIVVEKPNAIITSVLSAHLLLSHMVFLQQSMYQQILPLFRLGLMVPVMEIQY